MKKTIIGLTSLLLVTTSLPQHAVAADGNHLASNLCGYVAANNKSRVRRTLKSNGVRLRNVYTDVKCNGLSLIRFALSSNADDAGAFLGKRLSASILGKSEEDGQTVLEWAEANGYAATQTVAAIKTKLKK